MKLGIGCVVVVSSLSTARAELAKLGDFALTDKVKKAGFKKDVTVLGCKGTLQHDMDNAKVVGVRFSADRKCDQTSVAAAIQKEYGGKPIASSDGKAQLWEGKTSSVMVVKGMSGIEVRLGLPGAGSKRVCFSDDGFAPFLQSFKTALAAGKPDAVAPMFKFPLKDFDDKVIIKDAKAFAKKFDATFDKDARAEAADLDATCDLAGESYEVSFDSSYFALEAKQVGGQWKWVEMNSRSTD